MTQSPPFKLEIADGIATLTMTRPKQRNPFTPEFTDAIATLLQDIQSRNDIDVRPSCWS